MHKISLRIESDLDDRVNWDEADFFKAGAVVDCLWL
jgi:hypothetical protein